MSDVIVGPQRAGRNLSMDAKGSIHDDATAQAIGFRGGTVAADIHLDQFAPLLLDAFGNEWFERGSLSLYFKYATLDGEPVIAKVERPSAPGAAQVRAWMETPDGTVVCEGTASCGDTGVPTALFERDLRPVDPSTLRVLREVRVGEQLDAGTMQARGGEQRIRMERGLTSEPLDWYVGPSPWGGPIASPLTAAQMLHWEPIQQISRRIPESVGMFGAMELRFVNGPVLLDEDYRVTGRVSALSDSPKTEVLWYDTQATDASGRVIATARVCSRIVKASSALYADDNAGS